MVVVCSLAAQFLALCPAFMQDSHRMRLPRDTLPAVLPIEEIPLGLEPIRPVPADNPLTVAKVQLGRRLFFDPVLSADRTISCASCHDPARGLADAERTSQGIGGKRGSRNAPSLFNVAYGRSFFWDGRVLSLEEQATRPIESPQEMGNTLDEVIARLKGDPWYRDEFARAFPDGVTGTNLARAIASFQRVLLLGASKEDAFVYGDAAALDDRERHGKWLFESKGRCWRCHSGRNFSDGAFHNTGVSWNAVLPDRGRYHVTGEDRDAGRFKTPSLRGVAGTAPYMHDGSISTLQEVVEFYDRGGGKNPNLDPILTPLDLSTDEVRSLVAFLKALSVSRQESDRGK